MMKKRILFDLIGVIFDVFLEKFKISDNIKDFKIIWMGTEIKARYVVLPQTSDNEKPTLVFVDLRTTEFKSIKILLLKNPPKIFYEKGVEDNELELHSSLEVGEFESPFLVMENILGRKVSLYLEFHSMDMGFINITDSTSIFSNLYSSQLINMAYSLYLDANYIWVEKFFKTKEGEILPIKNHSVVN